MSTPAKSPRGNAWRFLDVIPGVDGERVARWQNGPLRVCSSHCLAEHHSLLVPQFHVSVSNNGQRPTDDEARSAIADFDMEDSREDNHFPGRARHYWLVEGAPRQECECKTTEETVISAFRGKVHSAHPDTGGSSGAFTALVQARNQALKEIEAA